MKKLFFLFAFLGAIFFSNAIHAQEYNSAVGARLGYPLSFSYKKFLGGSNAVEGIVGLGFWGSGSWIAINGLYQVHKPINGVDGLMWYFGGGAGVNLLSYKSSYVGSNGRFGINISGNLGLDYKISSAPINLSVDWIPGFYIGDGYLSGFGASYGGLAVRYTLN